MSEKTQAAFWSTIEKGDQLALSDEFTLIEQIKAKQGVLPIPLTVSEALTIVIPKKPSSSIRGSLAEYRIIKLGDLKPWIVTKTVGEAFSLYLFAAAQDWQPATRRELVAQDCTFLFEPPGDNRDGWDPGWEQNLRYIDEINHDASGFKYRIKPQGELSGTVGRPAVQYGPASLCATIVEYVAMCECGENSPVPDYSQLAIFEIGETDTGLIHIMLGREIASSDVDVVKH